MRKFVIKYNMVDKICSTPRKLYTRNNDVIFHGMEFCLMFPVTNPCLFPRIWNCADEKTSEGSHQVHSAGHHHRPLEITAKIAVLNEMTLIVETRISERKVKSDWLNNRWSIEALEKENMPDSLLMQYKKNLLRDFLSFNVWLNGAICVAHMSGIHLRVTLMTGIAFLANYFLYRIPSPCYLRVFWIHSMALEPVYIMSTICFCLLLANTPIQDY